MYDELVKRLREPCQYENCVLCQQAADAIEKLVGFVQEAERDRDEYRERLDKANDAVSGWYRKALHPENMSSYNEGERAAYRTALSEIANLHAADVVERQKGEWIAEVPSSPSAGYLKLRCSECKAEYAFLSGTGFFFCPNCGSEMRGVKHDK